jgi:hypothetical protein
MWFMSLICNMDGIDTPHISNVVHVYRIINEPVVFARREVNAYGLATTQRGHGNLLSQIYR